MEKEFYNDLRQHQLDAVEALVEVDKILTENNIPYFLVAGSTLGAVRHKGFIPWDDDIDIGVFYKDKKKAYQVLKDNLPPKYMWKDHIIDGSYPRLFGKILLERVGLIDVFVIVKASNNRIERNLQWFNRKILFKLYKAKINYSNRNENRNIKEIVKVKIARHIAKHISKEWIICKIEVNENRYEQLKDNKYYLNIYSAYSLEKELIESKWISDLPRIEFEGHYFPTVNDTHAYLSHLYGDYMKIPQGKERFLRHEEYF